MLTGIFTGFTCFLIKTLGYGILNTNDFKLVLINLVNKNNLNQCVKCLAFDVR